MDSLPQGTNGEFRPNHDETDEAVRQRFELYDAKWVAQYGNPEQRAEAQKILDIAAAREAVESAFDQPRKEQYGQ